MAKPKPLKVKDDRKVSQVVSADGDSLLPPGHHLERVSGNEFKVVPDNERATLGDNSGLSEEDMAEVFADGASVDGEALKELPKHVDRYVALESEIEALGETLKEREQELNKLQTVTLPDLMKKARITNQDMDSGHRITLGTAFYGGWPKDPDKRKNAFKALKKLGAVDILKHMVVTEFTPEQHDEARKVLQYLRKKKLTVSDDTGVHALTYRKWAKEMMADEKTAVPFLGFLNDLGLHMIEQATVKLLKPKKRKTDGKSEEAAGKQQAAGDEQALNSRKGVDKAGKRGAGAGGARR